MYLYSENNFSSTVNPLVLSQSILFFYENMINFAKNIITKRPDSLVSALRYIKFELNRKNYNGSRQLSIYINLANHSKILVSPQIVLYTSYENTIDGFTD